MVTAREDAGDFAALMEERARIADYLVRHMREVLGERGGYLAKTTEHMLSAPGKLLRPLLLLDACRAAGGDISRVFPAACGTEYGHVASLIHDDIIDGDDARHGRPTLHVKFNLPAAILTGDLLIFETFLSYTECHEQGVAAERVLQAIRTLSRTCIEMCQGQALEATIAGKLDTTEEMYLEVIRLKTATFCSAAGRIGARLGGAAEEAILALGNYGHNLGMAFQIVDDLLSFIGSTTALGKPVSSDVRNKRVTLPIIYALQSRDRAVTQRIRDLFAADDRDHPEVHGELLHVLNVTRALDRARAVAYRYTARAKQQLDLLPYSEARERLRALSEMFLSRDH
ncbi:MAG: polyprenyl synthetase family protein [Ktedonobacterales bacterium]|nr:polyprenyl synthetase family protein [Ktedonobacterales bacterium]